MPFSLVRVRMISLMSVRVRTLFTASATYLLRLLEMDAPLSSPEPGRAALAVPANFTVGRITEDPATDWVPLLFLRFGALAKEEILWGCGWDVLENSGGLGRCQGFSLEKSPMRSLKLLSALTSALGC